MLKKTEKLKVPNLKDRLFVFVIQTLYNYRARKMVLFGIGQIGCSPNELAQNNLDGRTCVERINAANQIFNNKLKSLTAQFNNLLPDERVIYINDCGIFQDIISNPSAYSNYFSNQIIS
ncbi:GDSL esterase/lipase [Spatholobus suberectus]|nr:GDSL esterase/lipase [Spatholobus suberectus]